MRRTRKQKSPRARHGRAGFGALAYRTLTRVTLSGRTSCGRAGSFAGCGRESDASELSTVLIAHDQCAMSLAPNTMSPQRSLRLASSPGHALVIEITAKECRDVSRPSQKSCERSPSARLEPFRPHDKRFGAPHGRIGGGELGGR